MLVGEVNQAHARHPQTPAFSKPTMSARPSPVRSAMNRGGTAATRRRYSRRYCVACPRLSNLRSHYRRERGAKLLMGTPFASWSGRARRCTWKSSRSTPTGRRPSIAAPTSSSHVGRPYPVGMVPHAWRGWRSAVHIVKPETVVTWHRRGFRLFWTWKSQQRSGRPGVPPDVRALIREMSTANPLWGAPRIHGELRNWESR